MRAALCEAQKGLGQTSPNPAVGAVLVQRQQIVARGYHRAAGRPHAEVECLRAFGRKVPADAIFYVTLEPCSTTGRTPPCTDALIASGLKRVVVGATDPNPAHAGRGIQLLRDAGIDVVEGVLAPECTQLNEAFNKWIRTRQPFVIAKCGMTLDGRLSRRRDEERWITSATSRKHANHFRAQVDAILIGAETLRIDNPRLTARGVLGARQPWRVVVSRSGRLPRDARLFTDRYARRTLIYRNERLEDVLKSLGKREITSVLIEGGGDILGHALDERLVDKVHIYLAPLFTAGPTVAFAARGAGSTQEALRLRNPIYKRIGGDVLLRAHAEFCD